MLVWRVFAGSLEVKRCRLGPEFSGWPKNINTIFSRSINNNSYYYKYILTYLSSVSVKLSVKSKTFSYLILYFHIMAFFKLSTVAHVIGIR